MGCGGVGRPAGAAPAWTRIAGAVFVLLPRLAAGQQCGDTLASATTLSADLECPTGHGLLVVSDVTLDCAGHAIRGGGAPGQYGVYVRDASQVVVQNCIVADFEVGIRLRGATGCTVQDNVLSANTRYGLEITQVSTAVLVQRNQVVGNGDEGIHVSGPSNGDAAHVIAANTLDGNAVEGIYLLASSGNTITGNTIQNHASAGLYVKDSHRNRIEDNVLTRDPMQLVAGSQLNLLRRNTIVGQRLKLDGSLENHVEAMRILGEDGRPSNAYDLNAASGNRIVDSEAVEPGESHIRAANGAARNTFVRFAASPSMRCSVDATSSVTVSDPDGRRLRCRRRPERRCGDGRDNDADGAADCRDTDCSGRRDCP